MNRLVTDITEYGGELTGEFRNSSTGKNPEQNGENNDNERSKIFFHRTENGDPVNEPSVERNARLYSPYVSEMYLVLSQYHNA